MRATAPLVEALTDNVKCADLREQVLKWDRAQAKWSQWIAPTTRPSPWRLIELKAVVVGRRERA